MLTYTLPPFSPTPVLRNLVLHARKYLKSFEYLCVREVLKQLSVSFRFPMPLSQRYVGLRMVHLLFASG